MQKFFIKNVSAFIKKVNHDGETGFELSQDIQTVINLYRRKSL